MKTSYDGKGRITAADLSERLHDPWLASPLALELSAAGLAPSASRVTEGLVQGLGGDEGHPQVVWGGSGCGKSHLAALVAARVARREGLVGTLKVFHVREDAAPSLGPLDLYLSLIEEASRTSGDPAHVGRIAAVYDLPPGAAEKAAEGLLESMVGDGPVLLVLEGADALFARWGQEARGRFEEFLGRRRRWALLATAQVPFDDTGEVLLEVRGNAADVHGLRDLEPNEIESFGRTVFGSDGEATEGVLLLRAGAHLLGESRRIVATIAEAVLVRGHGDPAAVLQRVLARLSPDFRAVIDRASAQQRRLLAAFARARRALRVKDVSRACFLSSQTVSSQLGVLRELDMVAAERVGRETFYDISDPALGAWLESESGQADALAADLRFLVELVRAEGDASCADAADLLDGAPRTWRAGVPKLIARHREAGTLPRLAASLASASWGFHERRVDGAGAALWRDLWWEWGGREPELLPPLRLVDAALRDVDRSARRAMLDLSRPLRRLAALRLDFPGD